LKSETAETTRVKLQMGKIEPIREAKAGVRGSATPTKQIKKSFSKKFRVIWWPIYFGGLPLLNWVSGERTAKGKRARQ